MPGGGKPHLLLIVSRVRNNQKKCLCAPRQNVHSGFFGNHDGRRVGIA